jgi:hypothetical protein
MSYEDNSRSEGNNLQNSENMSQCTPNNFKYMTSLNMTWVVSMFSV